MSKHEVSYFSRSKNRSFMLEELSDFHLVSAYNKLNATIESRPAGEAEQEPNEQPDGDARVLAALKVELETRKLDPRYKGGMAPDDPRLATGGSVQDLRR